MRAQTRFLILSLMLLSLSVSAMALNVEIYSMPSQNSVGDNVSVMVRVTENSTPLSNTLVNFITNMGYLSSSSALTNTSGYGHVYLTTTEAGVATVNASVGSISNTTDITFSPLKVDSISIAGPQGPVTAGNVTTFRISMLDRFGNINDTAELTIDVKIEDVFGHILKEDRITRAPYTLTHITSSHNLTDRSVADMVFANSVTTDQNVVLSINSTIAGNINISASYEGISNSRTIEVEPAPPSRMGFWYNEECTVNTTSEIIVRVYDNYNNFVANSQVLFNATPPEHTPHNSHIEYNSLNLSNLYNITGINGLAYTVFRTDKRAGANTINIAVANSSINYRLVIKGLADSADSLFLTHSPTIAYANNEDKYKLTGQVVDQFLNPIIPDQNIFPIKEQIVFYDGSNSLLGLLNSEGKSSIQVGPTPYIENVSITATYRNSSGHTNISNSTVLQFIAGSNISLDVYSSYDTLLAQGLNGNHESTIKATAIDQWGHTLPGINLTISTTNATIGSLSMNGINATSINVTTNEIGRASLKFVCGDVPGNTTIVATAGSATASIPITVKDVPFLSATVSVEPESLNSGDVVSVTSVVSIEGDLPVTRPAASAMLVLDRSGSMDPDYYAGTPLDVVLVIDRSGSMVGKPIADAKAAAKEFMGNLVSNSKVGIVSFATSSTVDCGMTSLNVYDNKISVNRKIDSMVAEGWTAMGNGMNDANNLLMNNGRPGAKKVMIVLTDGETNRGTDPEDSIPIANENGITIYTIGLGDVDEPLLRHIASETGGKYYYTPDSSNLGAIYASIAQELSDYDVSEAKYGEDGFTPYDFSFSGSISRRSTFEDTFTINETIDDLKVMLKWDNSASDLHLYLTSPSGIVYGSGHNTTGYYPSGASEYIWIEPISYLYSEDTGNSVEFGTWTVKVSSGSVVRSQPFTISTYIDKKSASKLSSHAFLSSFDENRGDKAGLALYSYENIVLTNTQTSYVHDNSTWTGYFTVPDTARYNFNISWSDSSSISANLYDGTDLLGSSSGTGTCEVSSLLRAEETYRIDIVKGAGSFTDTRFTIDVSALPLDTVMAAYYDGSRRNSGIKYRTWGVPQWSAEKSVTNVGNTPAYMVLRSNPKSPEMIMAISDNDYNLNVQTWNGLSWASTTKLVNRLNSYKEKSFDISYEQSSGNAVVVFTDWYNNRRVPRYTKWNGLSWSSDSPVDSNVYSNKGNVAWIRLESNPSSDEMVLVTLDDKKYMSAQVWNGNSWGNAISLTSSAITSNYQCFDVIYEQGTGRAMVVWADSRSIKYRIWSGNSWGREQNLYSVNNAYWLKLAADPSSNNLILAYQDSSNAVYAFSWSGSSWSSRQSIGSNTGSNARRSMDVAFEQSGGRALIVWGDSTSVPKYRTWTGSSWDRRALQASNIGDTAYWVQLTPDPASNEMFLMTSDRNNDINIQKWTNSSWSSTSEVETSYNSNYECFDIAFNYQKGFGGSDQLSWSQWNASVKSTFNNDSLAHLSNVIDTITADGLTAIDEGLFVANNELSSVEGNSTIVIMTDGIDNAGYHSLLGEAYRAKERNTVIYTVGFGNSESEVDPMLSEIARITGGEYYFAPNSSVLKDIFRGIAEQITNFSAQGPSLNIQIPRNYVAPTAIGKASYIPGSSNCTTGNMSSFVVPGSPGKGNAEPSIIALNDRYVLSWQLPNLNPGEKWGIWYQMNVAGSGYLPIIMPQSNISYVDLDGSNVTVYLPSSGGSSVKGTAGEIWSYSLGSLTMTTDKPVTLINEPSKLTLSVKDTTGNYSFAYVTLYSNLGYFDHKQNPINITVIGSETLNFSSATAGNAYIKAYAHKINSTDLNDTKECEEVLVVRPKGMISIK